MKNILKSTALALSLLATTSIHAAPVELTLDAGKTGAAIPHTMYGVFFEDINYGADGGLYAEMIKNRSFEFPQSLLGWTTFGKVSVETEEAPFERNPHYVRLKPANHPHKRTGLDNEGFNNMSFKANEEYRFSVWARKPQGAKDQKIRIELITKDHSINGAADITVNSSEWKKYTTIVKSRNEVQQGKLRIFFQGDNQVDLEHISLFPIDTWKGRENGLRKDLAQALYDLKPTVFRFPGGCIVEGTNLEDRYDWKKSVGPVENRPTNENRWQFTFTNRFFPDYYQSYGMGFYEFFLLSEDLGAEALPILNCGMACQYQGKEVAQVGEQLDCFVQDALDLIEFANGPVTSTWGKVRAEMGHPEPFNLKYIGIGNEQWGPGYPERLEIFVKAIRKAYPKIQIIGSSGPSADGKDFDYLWPEMRKINVDLVDEHYYKAPEWFLANANRYDKYPRKGPKVFAGEYAAHDAATKKMNNLRSALSEAAFMTGLERNADVVEMATYAPLFAHVDAWQWRSDLIWFDNLKVMKTPNYFVQQMYGHNKGTHVLNLTRNGQPLIGEDNLYGSATIDKAANEIVIKLVNNGTTPIETTINFKGLKSKQSLGKTSVQTLTSPEMTDMNTIGQEPKIAPKNSELMLFGKTATITIPAQTFQIYRIKIQ